AIFSFLPPSWLPGKLLAEFAVVGALILLNLRGVKESVLVLTPIFLGFIVSHVILIGWGVLHHASHLSTVFAQAARDTRLASAEGGLGAVALILLRAFSLGGGTYTGIEAVSNGVGILSEPRVRTGKRSMLYM